MSRCCSLTVLPETVAETCQLERKDYADAVHSAAECSLTSAASSLSSTTSPPPYPSSGRAPVSVRTAQEVSVLTSWGLGVNVRWRRRALTFRDPARSRDALVHRRRDGGLLVRCRRRCLQCRACRPLPRGRLVGHRQQPLDSGRMYIGKSEQATTVVTYHVTQALSMRRLQGAQARVMFCSISNKRSSLIKRPLRP